MTILSRIRSRVGLLVGIIFLALLSFVLTDMFNTQHGMLSGGPGSNDVGEINGNTISVSEFKKKLDDATKDQNLTNEQESQMSDNIWQDLINQYVYEPQFKELGISVTDDELADQMFGEHPSPYLNSLFSDPQTGQLAQQFQGPDGQLSGAAVHDFVLKMDAKTEQQWINVEKELRKMLLREKYNTLLRKGFYVTTAQAKREYADENTKYNFKYVVKNFKDVPDSSVKVNEAEIKAWYDANQWKFKQSTETRSIEYIAFDIRPSADDIAQQRKDMEKIASDFKAQKPSEDSIFVLSKTENGMYQKKYLHSGQFPVGADSAFLKAAPGEVLGPFIQNDNISVYKVIGQKFSADSAKVRHILVAYKGAMQAGPDITRTKEQAKNRADSILRAVKGGKKMEDLVEKLTDDPGSKSGNKGDYGWFSEESGFVQEFKDAGFKNPVGATVVVETSFGYHVIQVLGRTKETKKVQVVSIDKMIEPSENTIRDVYNRASEFAGKNNTGELFAKAAEKDNLNVLKTEPVPDNARMVSGIENSRDVVRWMYDDNTEVGSVSQPFTSGDRYVVCLLTKILKKGTKPLEEKEVHEMCELEARKAKKAQMFVDELKKKPGSTLDQWAANHSLNVMPAVGVTFATPFVQGAGYENAVVGTLAGMKPGQVSGPIKGSLGVYVVMLETVTQPEPLTDINTEKTKVLSGMSSRVDGVAFDILKEEADIIDNRSKHF